MGRFNAQELDCFVSLAMTFVLEGLGQRTGENLARTNKFIVRCYS